MSSISPFVEKTQIEIRVHKIERPRDRVIPDRSTLSRPSTRWQVSRKDPMVNSSHPNGLPSPMKFRSSVWYHPDANFVSFLIIPYNHEGFSVLELDWYEYWTIRDSWYVSAARTLRLFWCQPPHRQWKSFPTHLRRERRSTRGWESRAGRWRLAKGD